MRVYFMRFHSSYLGREANVLIARNAAISAAQHSLRLRLRRENRIDSESRPTLPKKKNDFDSGNNRPGEIHLPEHGVVLGPHLSLIE